MIEQLWTGGEPAESLFHWKLVPIDITDEHGTVIYKHPGVEVPEDWSYNAAQTLAQKYLFRGVTDEAIMVVTNTACPKPAGAPAGEWSLKQVAWRIATFWGYWGRQHGYFETDAERDTFINEVMFGLFAQIFAPNSPQWFNTGVVLYGIHGNQDGNWVIKRTDSNSTYADNTETAYARPAVMACHLKSIKDTMFGPESLTDFWVAEARLFKFGSGNGANWWRIRGKGEPLSKGGVSSGLMSFLQVPNAVAGTIKSGGTTRRAAKMVSLDLDHPEIKEFITWKAREERKAMALVDHGFSAEWNAEGGAYETVGGQNSNNSVAIPAAFYDVKDRGLDWYLIGRVKVDLTKLFPIGSKQEHPQGIVQRVREFKHGSFQVTAIINIDGADGPGWYPILESVDPEELLDMIARCAWVSADPGVHNLEFFEAWNPVSADGKVKQTNPCSEYLHLENTSCNLMCLNMLKVYSFTEDFKHAVKLMTYALDITVSFSSLPSVELAWGAYNYRSLGLGFAGLGAHLMCRGIAYDSDIGRKLAAEIACSLTTIAWETSAELAERLGAFPRYEANRDSVSKVIMMHSKAAKELGFNDYSERLLRVAPKPVRNSFVSLIMPAGTVGLIMDCDTTGIEPFFALRAYKKLAGGGSMTIACDSVREGLKRIGCSEEEIFIAEECIAKEGTLENWSKLTPSQLAIFDTAVPYKPGGRSISWQAHIKMLGAVQPFISGASSKTINMPHNSSVADVKEAYELARKLGIKCVALYRDGCKMSQPLNIPGVSKDPLIRAAKDLIAAGMGDSILEEMIERREHAIDLGGAIIGFMGEDPERFWHLLQENWEGIKIPKSRNSYTEEFTINSPLGPKKFHLCVGLTDKGDPIEVFMKCGVGGNFESAVVDVLGITLSYLLQEGMPLMRICKKFILSKMRFEPMGFTDRPELRFVNNMMEAIMKLMAIRHLNTDQLAELGIEKPLDESEDLIAEIGSEFDGYEPETEETRLGVTKCIQCGYDVPVVGCVPCARCGYKPGGCGA